MKSKMKLASPISIAIPFLLYLIVLQGIVVEGRSLKLSLSKPKPNDAAAFARWLISSNSWGVLSTISEDLGGAPFGNIVSFSDGLPGKEAGLPYFYITFLDPTTRNALKDQRASLAVSEYQIGTCGETDPEDPTCARITLTGKVKMVDSDSKEEKFAQNALFAKHPVMKDWPKDHRFQVFKLEIEDIFLVNSYGGRKVLSVDQYLHWKREKVALSS